MSLDKTALRNLIRDKLEAIEGGGINFDDYPIALEYFLAIADAIITHITTSAVISGIEVDIDNGTLATAFSAATVLPNDGGATLKTSMASAVSGNYATGTQKSDTGEIS